jgi:hypothetical protein
MKTIAERIAAVEAELGDILSLARRCPGAVPGVGKLSMAHYFVRSVVEDGAQRKARVSAMATEDGGMDFSLPVGDR